MKNIYDQINEKTDIVALVSSYVKLERRGKNYFGLCPFHDDSDPSMSVSPERNIFKCFSCGEGGGPIAFYQKINHTTFNEAAAALAEPLGIKVGFQRRDVKPKLGEHKVLEEVSKFYQYVLNNSKSSDVALKYLSERKLNPETIKHFKLGFSPNKDVLYNLLKEKNFNEEHIIGSGIVLLKDDKYRDFFHNRIMFPITDIEGNVVAFSGRSIDGKEPKYYNSPETKTFKKGEILYHLHESLGEIRKAGHVILHEGYFDCISSYEAGVKNTVATMGTTLTLDHAKLLSKYTKRVIIAFDGDEAGVNAAIKAIDVLSETKLRIDVLELNKGEDPDDFIRKHGKEKYLNLYKTNLKDQYEYTYSKTKENLNLKNVNDMAILKDATRKMLINAPAAVKELYVKRLSEDLNVSVSSLVDVLKRPQRQQRPVKHKPKQKLKKPLKPKFYRSEDRLFLIMLQSKEKAIRIDQELSHTYVCDLNVLRLRTILMVKFYEHYDEFDKEIFISIVNEEDDRDVLINKLDEIFNNLDNQIGAIYEDHHVDEELEALKKVVLEKEYLDIKKEIEAEPESFQKTYFAEKLIKLRRKKLNIEDTD